MRDRHSADDEFGQRLRRCIDHGLDDSQASGQEEELTRSVMGCLARGGRRVRWENRFWVGAVAAAGCLALLLAAERVWIRDALPDQLSGEVSSDDWLVRLEQAGLEGALRHEAPVTRWFLGSFQE